MIMQPAKFLPQGWTEEKLANATDEDWDTLTDQASSEFLVD